MRTSRPRVLALGVLGLLTAGLSVLTVGAPAHADGPGVGTPWVVSVGDSYISGEAGRWAGNSNASESYVDALGPTAYYDNATNTGEQITRCHRSKAAEVFIGGGVNSLNLACSGAKTSTFTDSSGNFKPGLDFYNSGGNQGQALMLQGFAATHNVKMVAVSIGGNDFNFASIVQSCVTDFLTSPTWWKNYCNDDSSVTSNFTAANVAAVRARISTAYQNVRTAMRNAGYADNAWTLMVQNYESPIPNGSAFRYSESGYTRQNTGGCGFWNNDATWANNTALPTIDNTVFGAATDSGLTNVRTLNLAGAFNGHRLCENTDNLVEANYSSWRAPGAVDKSEWIDQIRTASTATSDYYIQESLHPNYWGELAVRSCLRQAWNAGAPRSGTCTTSGTGLVNGEPRMALN
ncbi:hypothetical protein [Nocardioides cynanchi]|uniref:hypothetical protein n=1 Tax=Nocardioides cynanchi TaxID=2558918 RepID=UPI00192DED8C|nr:hypothetical protein [Nocardioides cynanchi]